MVDRYDYDHTMSESLSAYPDGQFVLYSDYASLQEQVEKLTRERSTVINDPSEVRSANIRADLAEDRIKVLEAELAKLREGAEPVAWRYRSDPRDKFSRWLVTVDPELAEREKEIGNEVEPLYLHPTEQTE